MIGSQPSFFQGILMLSFPTCPIKPNQKFFSLQWNKTLWEEKLGVQIIKIHKKINKKIKNSINYFSSGLKAPISTMGQTVVIVNNN